MNIHTATHAELDAVAVRRDAHGSGYPFETIDQITAGSVLSSKRWIIKGVIARGETSAWIAPPGGLKSALITELCVCTAWGDDWHGFKSKRIESVVYFALERADLVRRRIRAHIDRWARQAGQRPEDLPDITVVASTIDLMDAKNVNKVITTIRNIKDVSGGQPGLLVFDTFAKLVAAGGGDEDKAKDQGRVFANVQRIKDALNLGLIGPPHVALIGHTGKDETRGSRGSNAILGDVDLMVTISGDEVKTATVTKANDAPEGPLFSFKSETWEFGTDEDGDPITVNIVSGEDVSAQVEAKPRSGWTAGLRLVRDSILEAIDQRSVRHVIGGDGPTVNAIEVTQARDIHRQRYVSTGEGDRAEAERKAWARNFAKARDLNLISGAFANDAELIWLVKP